MRFSPFKTPLILLVLSFSFTAAGEKSFDDLVVLTFNIRYGTARDEGHLWQDRKEAVAEAIRQSSPDLLGLQEALDFQVEMLADSLGPKYAVVGEGRDGGTRGEYSAIFFSNDRFCLARAGRFWLSESPEKPGSKSWSGLPRIVTWCELIEKETGRRLAFANTHFSHNSKEARLKSAQLIANRFSEEFDPKTALLLVGDFNCTPGSNPHDVLTESKLAFKDALIETGSVPQKTFSGFREEVGEGQPIDWILYRGDLIPRLYEVLDEKYLGRIPSDHFPVLARLDWP